MSVILSENKCSRSLIQSAGGLIKDDIADGLECPLKVPFRYCKLTHCLYLIHIAYTMCLKRNRTATMDMT